MPFTHRPLKIEDLKECTKHFKDRFLFPGADLDLLLDFWRMALKEGICKAAVAEDNSRPKGQRIVAFGISLFITDGFSREIKAGLPPFVFPQLLHRWKKGERLF